MPRYIYRMHRLCLLLMLLGILSCKSNIEEGDIAIAKVIDRPQFQEILNQKAEDKILIVNFWATWCAPCVEELPFFEQIYRDYNDEVEMVFISLDDSENVETLVNPFLKNSEITASVKLLDDPYSSEWIPLVDPHWDGAIPVTLIKYKGDKRFYNRTFTYEELEKEINTLL